MSDNKNINDILSSVLENKELMSKISGIVAENKSESKEDALPSIISAISESMNTEKDAPVNKEIIDTEASRNHGEAKNTSPNLSRLKFNHKESDALLRAIKPFLSKERCELVDNILKFEQLTSIVELMR